MRLAGHVTCISKVKKVHGVLVGKPGRRRLLEDLDVAGKIMLK
jgi:hypothetical protein